MPFSRIYYNGEVLLEGKELYIGSRDSYLLPLHVKIQNYVIAYATAEIYKQGEKFIQFRLTQPQDVIVFEQIVPIKSSEYYEVEYKEGKTYIYSKLDGRIEEFFTISFA